MSGIAVLDVAHGPFSLLNLGGDALITLGTDEVAGLGPLHALAFANGGFELGGDGDHIHGEHSGGAATVRTVHKGDGGAG